jgi:glycine cleavage system transcriptional repressor
MTRRFAVALMGRDQPGIVAGATGALLDLGCNVEDVATSILRGHFAMMLVLAAPEDLASEAVGGHLEFLRRDGLMVSVWPVAEALPSDRATHVLTVYGPDRPGIVHTVARELAQHDVNICDMTCRLHDSPQPLYVLTVELHLPQALDPHELQRHLRGATGASGLEVSLRSVEEAEL